MSGIWQERAVKKPEDFHAALWAGSCGIREDFALAASASALALAAGSKEHEEE